MKLDPDELKEFAEIWKAEFHEEISPGEAQTTASVLLELYSMLARAPKELAESEDAKRP